VVQVLYLVAVSENWAIRHMYTVYTVVVDLWWSIRCGFPVFIFRSSISVGYLIPTFAGYLELMYEHVSWSHPSFLAETKNWLPELIIFYANSFYNSLTKDLLVFPTFPLVKIHKNHERRFSIGFP